MSKRQIHLSRFPDTPFDYAAIGNEELASEVQAAAERIRVLQKATVVDIGRELLTMKAKLDHGQFIPWVEQALSISRRTATNMMAVAERLGDPTKWEMVSHLPPKLLYDLAAPSTPDAIRNEALKVEPARRIDPASLRQTIEEARRHDAHVQVRARAQERRDETESVQAKWDAQQKIRAVKDDALRKLGSKIFNAGLGSKVGTFMKLKKPNQSKVFELIEAGDEPEDALRKVLKENSLYHLLALTTQVQKIDETAVAQEIDRLRWANVTNMVLELIPDDQVARLCEAIGGLSTHRAPTLVDVITLAADGRVKQSDQTSEALVA